MADKKTTKGATTKASGAPKKNIAMPPKEAPSKGFSVFKLLIILLVFLMLGGVGFAAGVYFNVIDIAKIATSLQLHQYPVIGQYFPKQPEPVGAVEQVTEAETLPTGNGLLVPADNIPQQGQNPTTPTVVINDGEKEKMEKAQQQEEAKKTSKLSRLYGAMKPEEAVPILNQLNDDTVLAIMSKMEEEQVAKLLALMDNKRAARLTQTMLKGKQIQ